MGQKVNPHGLRVGVIKDWDSKWYAESAIAHQVIPRRQVTGKKCLPACVSLPC